MCVIVCVLRWIVIIIAICWWWSTFCDKIFKALRFVCAVSCRVSQQRQSRGSEENRQAVRAFLSLLPSGFCVLVRVTVAHWFIGLLGFIISFWSSISIVSRVPTVTHAWLSTLSLSLSSSLGVLLFLYCNNGTNISAPVRVESVKVGSLFFFSQSKLLFSSNRRFRAGWRILLVCLPHSQPQQQQPLGRSSVPVNK